MTKRNTNNKNTIIHIVKNYSKIQADIEKYTYYKKNFQNKFVNILND